MGYLLIWTKNLSMKRLIRGFFYFNILLILITILGGFIFPDEVTFDIAYFSDYSSWFLVLLGIYGYLNNKKYFSLFFWKGFIFYLTLFELSIVIRDKEFFIIEDNISLTITLLLFYGIFVFLEILSIYLYIKSNIWLSNNDK